MPRTRMSLAVVTTFLLWSACRDGRPIVTITTGTAGGGGGAGSAGTTGDAGPNGGRGGSALPCDGGVVLFCTDGSPVCSLEACPGTAGTSGSIACDGGPVLFCPDGSMVCSLTACPGTAGTGGSAGTGAAGAGQVGVGTLIDCPASPPSGACSIEYMDCEYPNLNTTCRCTSGEWSCSGCPPAAGALGAPGMCRYGNLTCSSWGCGVCPDAHPTEGAVCGNSKFKCVYGSDVCLCGGNVDGWRCGALSCPQSPASDRRTNCATFALADGTTISFDHACLYAAENQTCSCLDGSGFGTLICNCPTALPAEGSACVGPSPCTYAGVTCNCTNNQWRCGGACPASKPTAGASCSTQVSCSYARNGGDGGTDYCACNGSTWSCQ